MVCRILLLCLLCTSMQLFSQNIYIRPAEQQDLVEIFELDEIITYEYFKPLYENGYKDTPLGKNPNFFIELELENDKKIFPNHIEDKNAKFLLACDESNNKIVGFIIGHKDSAVEMEIDLLLILKEYRKKGIGRKLVKTLLVSFPEIKTCFVHPFKNANQATLTFYESLGFVKNEAYENDQIVFIGLPYTDLYFYYTYEH